MKSLINIIFIVIVVVCLFSSLANATSKIIAIDVYEDLVKIDATEPMKFSIDNSDPFNIVVDLINTEVVTPKNTHFKGKGLISEVRVEKTTVNKNRVIITLVSPAEVETLQKDNTLFINLTTKNPNVTRNADVFKLPDIQKAIVSDTPSIHQSLDKTLQPATEIIAIFVEKVASGAEVTIKGNGAMPEPVVYKLDSSIIIELERLTMNAYVPKKMIEPIKAISYTIKDNLTKIMINLEPDAFSPYLKKDKEFAKEVMVLDDEIIISVIQVPFIETQQVGYSSEIIDLDYNNADVKNIVQSIAIKVGYGWIIDENVTASVTIKQSATNWKEALKLLEKIADVQIVVDDKTKTIKVQKSEIAKLGVQKEGDLVSFDFQDADLSSVIMLLSEISGFNILIHPDIKDIKYKVNTKLKNVSWQKALDKIVKLLTLEYTVDEEDKIITIAPIETINKIEEARQKIRDTRAKVYESWAKLYTCLLYTS
ncbi:MAG: AMIN domain-containing protein, partial [Thermodesulfovibrionales bacterium]|nr:AMIN domain-containing protein [Thermodesulfovibrionales bacterium]